MDFNYIEQLLERYWKCETSLEEEALLRDFFNKEEVPGHLLRYKDWFVYQRLQQQEGLGEDFDKRVLAQVEAPVVKARRMSLLTRLMPLCKAAAVIAVVLGVGNLMQHSFFRDAGKVAATADTISEQISAPSVALSGEAAVAAKEQQMLDSLHWVDKPRKEIEYKGNSN